MNEIKLALRVDQLSPAMLGDLYMPCYPDERMLLSKWFKQEEPHRLVQGSIYFSDATRKKTEQVCPDSKHITTLVLDGQGPTFKSRQTYPAGTEDHFVWQAVEHLYSWAMWVLKKEDVDQRLKDVGFSKENINRFKEAAKNARY